LPNQQERQGRHDAASDASVKSKMAVFPRKAGVWNVDKRDEKLRRFTPVFAGAETFLRLLCDGDFSLPK
jgi:hypothetical protein